MSPCMPGLVALEKSYALHKLDFLLNFLLFLFFGCTLAICLIVGVSDVVAWRIVTQPWNGMWESSIPHRCNQFLKLPVSTESMLKCFFNFLYIFKII
jgi:hypothetical protein